MSSSRAAFRFLKAHLHKGHGTQKNLSDKTEAISKSANHSQEFKANVSGSKSKLLIFLLLMSNRLSFLCAMALSRVYNRVASRKPQEINQSY